MGGRRDILDWQRLRQRGGSLVLGERVACGGLSAVYSTPLTWASGIGIIRRSSMEQDSHHLLFRCTYLKDERVLTRDDGDDDDDRVSRGRRIRLADTYPASEIESEKSPLRTSMRGNESNL